MGHDHSRAVYFWTRVNVSAKSIGNENVPKIIINNTQKIFLTAISIFLVSNHNSFRVLFDKIASVYFIWRIYAVSHTTSTFLIG